MRIFFLLVFSAINGSVSSQIITTKTIIYSQKVKDSFELYISKPEKISPEKKYDVVYYCDADLKSGKKLREMINLPAYQNKVLHTIFVGIGHIGNFHVLRRRDFILPEIKGRDTMASSLNYGHIEDFYQFLKTELVTKINGMYPVNENNNTIAGHSLGGLFAFYCLFKNESLFKNYYALSPALWIDHYSIYKFNHLNNKANAQKNIYFSAGGKETMNHILKGTDEMKVFLDGKKYPGLSYKYDVHTGRTHNSQVELSLAVLLSAE